MSAPKFTVEYTDGTTEVVKMLPKAQLAYERVTGHSLRDEVGSITEIYQLVWFAMGRPGKNLDEWIENIEAVLSEDEENSEEEVPTSPDKSLD